VVCFRQLAVIICSICGQDLAILFTGHVYKAMLPLHGSCVNFNMRSVVLNIYYTNFMPFILIIYPLVAFFSFILAPVSPLILIQAAFQCRSDLKHWIHNPVSVMNKSFGSEFRIQEPA
jgi:hypothetical protein